MVINKKIKRTMLENKSQYVGSLILIILSCLLFTMFNQLTSNMTGIMTSFEKNYNQEDANFITADKINNLDEIESKFDLKIEEGKSFDYSVTDEDTLRIFRMNEKVDLPAVNEGTLPKSGEILIDPAYAKEHTIKIGDNVKVESKDFKVSGFVSLPNFIYPIKQDTDLLNNPKTFGFVVIPSEDFDKFGTGNSTYQVKFNDNSNSDDKISDLKNYLKDQNVIVLKWVNIAENPRVTYATAKIDGISSMSSTLPIFILLLTCILSSIVIWRMLKKEFPIIGTLYSFGYRKKEIVFHYLSFPFIISISGGIIGTILGALTLKPMLIAMLSYFNMPLLKINYDIKYIIISILLPIILLGASGFIVVLKALKNTPLDLIRGGKEKNKVGFIEKRVNLDKLKFNTKFKIREQLRSIPRSIFLLLGVSLATMLLLMGFVMTSSINYLINDTYQNTYKYQYQYLFNSLQTKSITGGEGFAMSAFTSKADKTVSFRAYGVKPDTDYITLKDKAGKSLSMDQVILTKPLADKLNIKVGDTVSFINKLDSKEYDITVDAIAETYVGDYMYMPIDKLNTMLNYPKGSYLGVWSADTLDIQQSMLLSTATQDDFKKAFDDITKPMQAYIGVISVLAFTIGLIVIYVVTSLIIEENKENISLMKVLGYRKKEIYKLVLDSSSIIVVLGYIIGIPLLLESINAMFKSAAKSMSFSFPIKIDYIYVFIGFIVIYWTYDLSKWLSKKKVDKISITEALKSRVE